MSRASGGDRGGSADAETAAAAFALSPRPYRVLPPTTAVTATSSSIVGSASLTTTTTTTTTTVTTFAASASSSAAGVTGASAATHGYRPTVVVVGGGSPLPPRPLAARTASAVSEEVWAKAIHAVKIQKMSLRQAAQLYGVHHMSLHRRVRGRYASALPPSSNIRAFLSPDDEAEVLGVLREQFLHEKRITTDDIRFVVRAIASQGGKRSIPPEFPPSRWIHDFKHAHGFVKLNSYAYPPASTSEHGGDGLDDGDEDMNDDAGSNYSVYSSHRSCDRFAVENGVAARARGGHGSAGSHGHPSAAGSVASNYEAGDRDDYDAVGTPNGSMYDAGLTTGSSSGGSYENGESEKRSYQLSHTVPPETWEKAIAAVEQQGMSLRAAAKMYGVHFAALHRRVKKRAQGEQGAGLDGYFQPDDEAGIIRVVVARAELGVLMTFDELMDLAQRAALRNLPDLSVEAARKLMTRFQARNEHSIRHIIADWPSPRANPLTTVPRVVNTVQAVARGHMVGGASAAAATATAGTTSTMGMARARSTSPAASSSQGRRSYGGGNAARAHAGPRASSSQQLHMNGAMDGTHSPLRTEFPPPPPRSSIRSRHALHSNGSSASGAPPPGPPPPPSRRGPPSMASAMDRLDARYAASHDDHLRRDRHRGYDGHASYDDDEHGRRRDSRDASSDGDAGDAVMFV